MTALMRVYHSTHHAAAIERDGFRDGEGYYLTTRLWRGVWVSAPHPLDINEGADGDVVLEIEIPQDLFAAHEWVEEGKPYREALIPADALNSYLASLRRVNADEVFDLRYPEGHPASWTAREDT